MEITGTLRSSKINTITTINSSDVNKKILYLLVSSNKIGMIRETRLKNIFYIYLMIKKITYHSMKISLS